MGPYHKVNKLAAKYAVRGGRKQEALGGSKGRESPQPKQAVILGALESIDKIEMADIIAWLLSKNQGKSPWRWFTHKSIPHTVCLYPKQATKY